MWLRAENVSNFPINCGSVISLKEVLLRRFLKDMYCLQLVIALVNNLKCSVTQLSVVISINDDKM